MKILDLSRAPNPQRLRLLVPEKGIDIEFEEVDIHRWREAVSARPSIRTP